MATLPEEGYVDALSKIKEYVEKSAPARADLQYISESMMRSIELLRLAGMLLDMGIDTEPLFAHLYLREHHTFAFEAYVLKNMKLSENGVASIYISQATQKKFSLSREDAGEATSYIDSIKGALIWIVFIEAEDGSIRVRLRSRFVAINQLAKRYRGGGHDCACGATVYSRREANKLLCEADVILKEYKENNEGWL